MGKFLCFDVFLNPNFRFTPFRLDFLRLVLFPCLCRCCRCLRFGWRDARTGAGFFREIPVLRDFPRISVPLGLRACLFVPLAHSFSAVSDPVAFMFMSVFPVSFSSVVVSAGSSNSVCNKLNLFPHALSASLLVVAPLSGVVSSPFFSVSSFSPMLGYSS